MKFQPGRPIELAEATPTLNRFLFDTECGGFLHAADLDQALDFPSVSAVSAAASMSA
jgi:hypothetical protein